MTGTEAFTIWTPLHLFNTLKYVISNDALGKCDAFFICQSSAMYKYLNNVKELGVFKNIYETDIKTVEKNYRLWAIESVIGSPVLYISHLFGKEAVQHNYSKLFFSVPTRVNDAIIRANKCESVCGLDDGIGSYLSNLYTRSLGPKYEFVKKLLRKNTSYTVEKVYLSCPEFCNYGESVLDIHELVKRKLTDEENDLLNRVFSYQPKEGYPAIVYLNQPLADSKDIVLHKEAEAKVVSYLKNGYKDNLIVRLHPREREFDFYKGVKIDENSDMWELMCNGTVTEDHILVAAFSTAQFTPKLFCDKEPYVVFTYKLYDDITDEDRQRYESIIARLRDIYDHPKRVIEIDSLDQLNIIGGILHR